MQKKHVLMQQKPNAQMHFMQTKDTRVLFVQTMMHTAADSSLGCASVHFTTSVIFHTHADFVASSFRNLSSCVVFACVCVVKFKLSCTIHTFKELTV